MWFATTKEKKKNFWMNKIQIEKKIGIFQIKFDNSQHKHTCKNENQTNSSDDDDDDDTYYG